MPQEGWKNEAEHTPPIALYRPGRGSKECGFGSGDLCIGCREVGRGERSGSCDRDRAHDVLCDATSHTAQAVGDVRVVEKQPGRENTVLETLNRPQLLCDYPKG